MAGDTSAAQTWLPSALLRVMAHSAMRRQDWMAGARIYSVLVRKRPLQSNIWVQYGHALKESGDYSAAEKAYRQALDIAPRVADTHLQLGHLLKLMGCHDDAARSYLRSTELDPEDQHARIELSNLRASGLIGPMSVQDRPAEPPALGAALRPQSTPSQPVGNEEINWLKQRVRYLEAVKEMLEREVAQGKATAVRVGPLGKLFTDVRGHDRRELSSDAWITEVTDDHVSLCVKSDHIGPASTLEAEFDGYLEEAIPMRAAMARHGQVAEILPLSVRRSVRDDNNIELKRLVVSIDGRPLLHDVYVYARSANQLDTAVDMAGTARYTIFAEDAFK